MPTKGTKMITEQLFNTVTAQLKKNPGKEARARIAAAHGIKPSTVAAVRQAKTWKEWQARKAQKLERVAALRSLDKTVKAEQIIKQPVVKNPIKPVRVAQPNAAKYFKDRRIKAVVRHTTATEVAIAIEEALHPLATRIRSLETALHEMQREAVIDESRQRRTFIARLRRGSK